jgi:hypothetical protein
LGGVVCASNSNLNLHCQGTNQAKPSQAKPVEANNNASKQEARKKPFRGGRAND